MTFGKPKVYSQQENEKIVDEIISGKRKGINERAIKAAIESGLITREMILGMAKKEQEKKVLKETLQEIKQVKEATK